MCSHIRDPRLNSRLHISAPICHAHHWHVNNNYGWHLRKLKAPHFKWLSCNPQRQTNVLVSDMHNCSGICPHLMTQSLVQLSTPSPNLWYPLLVRTGSNIPSRKFDCSALYVNWHKFNSTKRLCNCLSHWKKYISVAFHHNTSVLV